MVRGGLVDEGWDGGPEDCDDEAFGPAALEGAGFEGRGSLRVSAEWAALLCVRDNGFEEGDGGTESVLVPDLSG
jgi:hypothetical protein